MNRKCHCANPGTDATTTVFGVGTQTLCATAVNGKLYKVGEKLTNNANILQGVYLQDMQKETPCFN